MLFRSLKIISKKTLMSFIAGLIAILVIGFIATIIYKDTLRKESTQRATTICQLNKGEIEVFYNHIFTIVNILSKTKDIKNFAEELELYHQRSDIGDKENLNSNSFDYINICSKYKHLLNSHISDLGFCDLYIIDAENGCILYNDTQEYALGENLESHKTNKSNLATIWKECVKTDNICISDLTKLNPSENESVQYITCPIKNKNNATYSILAFKISDKLINAVLPKPTDRSKSEGYYLVGSDGIIRSSLKSDKLIVHENKINSAIIEQAEFHEKGIVTYNNNASEVIAAYDHIDIKGLEFIILAEINPNEILNSSTELRNIILTIIGVHSLFFLLLTWFITKNSSQSSNNPKGTKMTLSYKDYPQPVASPKGDVSKMVEDVTHIANSSLQIAEEIENITKEMLPHIENILGKNQSNINNKINENSN